MNTYETFQDPPPSAQNYTAMEAPPSINTTVQDHNGTGPTSAHPPPSAVSVVSTANGNGHVENGHGNGHGNGFGNDSGNSGNSGSGHGNSDSSGGKSPLNFSFLKSFTSEKKLKADGQPPKRRGPKPDSKPALTRRQELNRQAQRTHRERKELYIKALEQEVSRLKEAYSGTCRERDTATEENRQLKELLASHGIPLPEGISSPPRHQVTPMMGNISVAPTVGSSPHMATPQSTTTTTVPQPSPLVANEVPEKHMIDHDQIGIQFVLALEQPCMDHIQMLCTKSHSTEDGISGHALMATCPPASHVEQTPDVPYPHKMPEMPQTDLLKLLDLSARLPLDGEITPVMAWALIINDERSANLVEHEFEMLKTELHDKIRCYGFGAVLEEFEVRDALERIMTLRDGEGAAPVGMAISTNNPPPLYVSKNGRL